MQLCKFPLRHPQPFRFKAAYLQAGEGRGGQLVGKAHDHR
jgi:hypothetical protein